jgi:hypothetical protein
MAYRWKVALRGNASDLETVQEELRASDFGLQKGDGNFYLVGKHFEAIGTSQEVHASAREVIADINLSFRFVRHDFTAIGFGNIIEERHANGSKMTHRWIELERARSSVKVRPVVVRQSGKEMPAPPLQSSSPERMINAFIVNERFREAMKSFNIEPSNFSNLYIAYEAVRKGVSPSSDHKDLLALVWATKDEIEIS